MSVASTLILTITEREPFAGGTTFGDVGAYERLAGRARLAVDPRAAAHDGVVDLDRAPRNADGLVEFAADVHLLSPVDLDRGNRRLFVEFANRGNKRALQFFNDARHSNTPRTLADAGNGFLMRRGYTVVWVAGQGDVLPGDGRLVLDVPAATDRGRPLTGAVRAEFVADGPGVMSFPLSSSPMIRSYPAASRDKTLATLTRREYATDARVPVAPSEWEFARLEPGRDRPGAPVLVPSDTDIVLRTGFLPGWIYELIYTGRDPRVLGLGYVAVRNVVAFLKHGERDSAGSANPLRRGGVGIEHAYCWGRSQGGRVIREFVYAGWNADEEGRRVFEAAFPHVAGGGRMWLNRRFAQPTRLSGSQHQDSSYYGDRFPFSYARSTDHLTGVTDAILKRPDTDPLVMHTQSSTEYWTRRGSLVHTDTRGDDLPQPEGVRLYLWASSQHMADPWAGPPAPDPVGQQCGNVLQTSPLFRALLDHLDRWASERVPPPPSRVPTRAGGQLVGVDAWRALFPHIPGVALPREPARLPLLDYGPDAAHGYLSLEPPAADGREYPIFVPAVDADGNETAGIRVPLLRCPLGTYTGWNVRAPGFAPGPLVGLSGSFIPFPETRGAREAAGDPRPSVEERYPTDDVFALAVQRAAEALLREGFLLREDADRIVEIARRCGRTDVGGSANVERACR